MVNSGLRFAHSGIWPNDFPGDYGDGCGGPALAKQVILRDFPVAEAIRQQISARVTQICNKLPSIPKRHQQSPNMTRDEKLTRRSILTIEFQIAAFHPGGKSVIECRQTSIKRFPEV